MIATWSMHRDRKKAIAMRSMHRDRKKAIATWSMHRDRKKNSRFLLNIDGAASKLAT